jgi:hypothetical protein
MPYIRLNYVQLDTFGAAPATLEENYCPLILCFGFVGLCFLRHCRRCNFQHFLTGSFNFMEFLGVSPQFTHCRVSHNYVLMSRATAFHATSSTFTLPHGLISNVDAGSADCVLESGCPCVVVNDVLFVRIYVYAYVCRRRVSTSISIRYLTKPAVNRVKTTLFLEQIQHLWTRSEVWRDSKC